MANVSVIAILFFGICISSSISFVYGEAMKQKFKIIGHVYCDTCRVGIETSISQPIDGAFVMLQCKNRTNGLLTYESQEIMTDKQGNYEINVEGEYGESNCEVGLIKSPKTDCHDPTEELKKASVDLKALDGINGELRFASNLGFKKKVALPECTKVLKESGYFHLMEEGG